MIAAVPEWRGHEPAITPVEAGRTNRNYRVEVGSGTFFLRLSHEDTALLGIDRAAEYEAALAAAAAGGTRGRRPPARTRMPDHGLGAREPLAEGDMERGSVLADVVRVVSTIHAGPALPTTFDAFRIVEEYRRLSEEHGVAIPDATIRPTRTRNGSRVRTRTRPSAPMPQRPARGQLLERRRRVLAGGLRVLGMGDPFFDLGNLSINNGLSEASQERLLRLMFGEPTDAHRARLQLMRIMSDYREAMWGVIQQGLSTLDIDYVAYADRHFDRLSRSMADERFEEWLEQAAEAVDVPTDVPTEVKDDRARVVIVGGGVAGTSIAYHLTKLGWDDVLLVDRSELTSGSTFHSAGLVAQLRNSVSHTRMMMYGVELYPKLEAETGSIPDGTRSGRSTWRPPLPARGARPAGRLGKSFGLPVEIVSPEALERSAARRLERAGGAVRPDGRPPGSHRADDGLRRGASAAARGSAPASACRRSWFATAG